MDLIRSNDLKLKVNYLPKSNLKIEFKSVNLNQ